MHRSWATTMSLMSQRKIEELLARRIGLDPISTGPHVILGAARRRMAELGVADLGRICRRARPTRRPSSRR